MDLIQLSEEMHKTRRELNKAKINLVRRARDYAEKERAYRVALRQEILQLKEEGYAATIINDLARGAVAELKFERDMAQEVYNSARDYIYSTKVEASLLQSINKNQSEVG